MEEREKISVIVPVYNAEKTLDACLESICTQSYRNLEILMVNDGSTDGTICILNKWKDYDGRIFILDQKNQGAACARNKGLEMATGAYIGFADADDVIEPLIYEKLYEEMISRNADIVSAAIREIYSGNIIEIRTNDRGLPILSGREAACNMLRYQGGIRTVVWDKLYRADLLKDIRFREGCVYGEDTLFNFQAMMSCSRYSRIPYVGYTYDHTASSVTGRRFNSAVMSNVRIVYKMAQYCAADCDDADTAELQEAVNQYQITIYRQIFHKLLIEGDYRNRNKEEYLELKTAALSVDRQFVKKYLSVKDYIQWLLYLYWPDMFLKINRIHHRDKRS